MFACRRSPTNNWKLFLLPFPTHEVVLSVDESFKLRVRNRKELENDPAFCLLVYGIHQRECLEGTQVCENKFNLSRWSWSGVSTGMHPERIQLPME